MKRLVLLLSFIAVSATLFAQNPGPERNIFVGSATQSKIVADTSYSFNIGAPVSYFYRGTTSKLQAGFPYNALYLDQTFTDDISVSKGYYPDYIQLKWNVSNNTSSITHFQVFRKKAGDTDSVWVDNVDATARKWEDFYCEPNEIYKYTLIAEGIPGANTEYYTYIEGIGFRTPLATVTGRVSFSGGNGVTDVVITASTEDEVPAKSIELLGNSYLEIPQYTEEDFSGGFTFQSYLMLQSGVNAGIIKKEGDFELSYTGSALQFTVGTETVQLPYLAPTDTFFHVSAVYDGSKASIYVPGKYDDGEGNLIDTTFIATAPISTVPPANENNIFLGKVGTTYLSGNIDEVRIWTRALDSLEICRNYNRYITNDEDGLWAYLRMNEGSDDFAYDISKTGSNFNENHATFVGTQVSWSNEIPTIDQLGNKGITDEEGNYIIAGIPFLSGGSPYKFTPMLAPHEFDPGYKILFLSEDAVVHNNIDFTDISSFFVDGYVAYRNTTKLVEGVEVLVDGETVIGSDNKPVKTDNNGEFTVEVPIGAHFISLKKDGHGFENDGRWPICEENPDSIIRHNFNQNITFGAPFIDTTLITVIGRIIGGTGSNQIPMGFEQASNNIGRAAITLNHSSANPELTYNNVDSLGNAPGADTISYSVITEIDENGDTTFTDVQHFMSFEEQSTIVYTSAVSGEFVAKLIPEKFSIADIKIVNDEGSLYNFDRKVIDLSINPSLKYEKLYDERDSLLDSIPYHVELNYIFQNNPEISVTNSDDDEVFRGEEEIEVTDDRDGSKHTLIVDEHFRFPVFKTFNEYNSKISVFESYINVDKEKSDPNRITRQAIKEADIKIVNELAIQDKVKTYELTAEMKGEVTDAFTVGLPNVTKSANDKTSFTKKMEVYVTASGNTYTWEPGGEIYRAYILGQNPKGNNFYTEGQQVPEIILRDPPGTNSYAYVEKGSNYSVSSGYSTNFSNGSGFGMEILLGCEVAAGGGLAGPVIKTDTKNSANTNLSFSTEINSSGEYVQTYSFNERIETSSDPDKVGSMADIYIGKSYNYYYGETDNLKIVPKDLASSTGILALDNDELIKSEPDFTLGIVDGYIMNPDNSDTYFIYTQAHILKKLLPELEDRRNNLFLTSKRSDGTLKYTPVLDNTADIRYGIAHSFKVETVDNDTIVHAFYKMTKTDSIETYSFRPEMITIEDLNSIKNDSIYEIDSIRYYNTQIGIWIDAIRMNEEEKALAITNENLEQNISFDGGIGSLSRSETQTMSYIKENSRVKNLDFSAQGSVGFLFNKTGVVATGELSISHSLGVSTGEEMSQSMSYGYTFDDGDVGDYYSINIYRRTNDGIYNADSLSQSKLDLPSGFNYGILGQGVSLIGGGIAVGIAASYNSGGGIPIVAGATTMALAAGLSYIPYGSFKGEVQDSSESFTPGDIRVGSFDISSPIFSTLGGQTMCPFQDLEHTFFYRNAQGDSIVLHKPTLQREKPGIEVDPSEVHNVPVTDRAFYNLRLTNNSESEDDQWYKIRVVERYNPDGANIKIDGLGAQNRTFLIPANQTITKSLSVGPTDMSVLEYDSLAIALVSTCQSDPTDFIADISDTVFISASFQPTCTNVEITEPLDNWVVNVNDNDTMTISLGGYNLAYEQFESLRFEYKASSGNLWIPVKYFVNDPALANKDEKADTLLIEDKSTISFDWDMTKMKDRAYDLRAISRCSDVDHSENESIIVSGILDGQRPQVFGTPQPADGILNIDENISLLFNEPIEGGLLNNFNFDIKGTLNYFELKHEAYIRMNGATDYAIVPEGISFNNKSFTIECWVRPDDYDDAVLFSQGNDPVSNLEIGLSGTNKTYFKMGNVAFEAPFQFSPEVPSNAWQHMAWVFDYENGDIFIYQNDKIILEQRGLSVTYNNTGKIYVGKSAVDESGDFAGSMHELRIWSKFLSLGDVYANQYVSMTGNEVGLYGYWPMDEAFGEFAIDKAANRHMEIFSPWETYPGGSSWNFDGGNFLTFYTGYFSIIPEMDYTMEFWFKDDNPTDTVCLFSNQKGDGTEGDNLMDKALSILASPDGKIWVSSQGNRIEAVTNDYFNNEWHHFALILRRRGNAIAYIDGEAQNEWENTIIGGIAGANMVLGARIWNNSAAGSGSDYYYQGKLDEFRLWNLARTQTQIKMDMNAKLNGDEIGLQVYFPFEGFYEDALGVMQQKKTLENFDDDVNTSNAIPVTPDKFSTDAPDMKDVRPVQAIAYDFVAAEDEIIINPKSYLFPQLEKNIIEITVEGVEDKYGNAMASPVTWTAYVHRNQVRWEDERRTFTKEIYKAMDFVSTIKNTGGQQVGFTITNLPPWLSANPSSGTINPESTLEITFTINPALNIGEYTEDIVLHTENGFDEKLPLTVRVFKTPPDWTIDPSKYEYSMNIVGRVKIEGVLSTDIFDKLAAFVKDTLKGVSNVRYVDEFDSYLVFLSVYGDSIESAHNEKVEFRIWDASAGQILDNIIPDSISFEYEKIIGSTSNPVTFEATGLYRQYVPVSQGWNWVSFNKLSNNMDNLNQFFSALEPTPNFDQIKSNGNFVTYMSSSWDFGNLTEIDPRWMYQMRLSNEDTIIYSGEEIIPEENPIPLGNGWNQIGYLPDLSMDVSDALRLFTPTEGDVIKSQFAFSMYDDKAGWLGNLQLMQPHFGYKFKVQKIDTLIYPNSTVFKSGKIESFTTPPVAWNKNYSQYESNMSVIAKLDLTNTPALTINNQMVLGAFVDNVCRGYVAPNLSSAIGYNPFFLNVSGSANGKTVQFKLFDGNTGGTYRVIETKTFMSDAVLGTTKEPLVLTLNNITSGINEYGTENYLRCYPNPFNQQINIEFTGTNNDVTIDVVNATGSLVKRIYNGYPVRGNNTAIWDGRNGDGATVTSGIYYIRFIYGDSLQTVKISKTR